MKNLIKSFLGFSLFVFLLASCSSDPCGNNKDAFLKKFDSLVESIEAIEYDTKHSKWEGYNEEFKMMVEECYEKHEDDLTRREEREFGRKVAVYYVKTFSENVNLEEYAAKFGKFLDENTDNISEQLGAAIKDIDLNINIDDEELEELFEELGTDIEKMGKKWGKKLENILEKE